MYSDTIQQKIDLNKRPNTLNQTQFSALRSYYQAFIELSIDLKHQKALIEIKRPCFASHRGRSGRALIHTNLGRQQYLGLQFTRFAMAKKKEDSDYHYKIVLVGDSGVGKSNIISKFTKNEFSLESKTTIGVQFATKSLTIDQKSVKVQIWDTAGQERYRSMASAYYRGANGALLVYDITRATSFQNLQKWIKELRNYGSEDMVCLMVGNKADLKQYRSLKYEHGEQFAKKNGMAFMETSAMQGFNIQQAFNQMITEILKRKKGFSQTKNKSATLIKKQTLQISTQERPKKKCCNS